MFVVCRCACIKNACRDCLTVLFSGYKCDVFYLHACTTVFAIITMLDWQADALKLELEETWRMYEGLLFTAEDQD